MKRLFLSLFLLSFLVASMAQNPVPNAGFESWTNGTADGWNSAFSMTVYVFPISYSAGEASEDAHSGNYAMSLATQTITVATESITLPGICQLGNFETDSVQAYILGNLGDSGAEIDPAHFVSGGVPINAVPNNVKVWAKYLPDAMENDAMQIIVLATKHTVSGDIVIARGTYKSMTMLDEYTEIPIPLNVEIADETPDFLNIIFSSANSYNCGQSELLVDDITVDLPSGVCNINALDCSVTPNPSSDYINVRLGNNDDFTFELYDLNGKKVLEVANCSNATAVDVRNVSAGTYIAKITQKNNIAARKIVIE